MRLPWRLRAAAFWFTLAACSADPGRVRVPIGPSTPAEISLETFVYRPGDAGKHPVVVLSHGSAGGDAKTSLPSKALADQFVAQGFPVVVPMRRGRGKSEGVSLEGEVKDCDVTSWASGLAAANEDLTAAIDFALALPESDGRVILAGVSRGGFLSVEYAAAGERRDTVIGVVNFVGGWVAQAEDNCPVDFNEISFRSFGAAAQTRQLWLYGLGDQFYGDGPVRSYAKAFEAGGGSADVRLFEGVPDNGHWLPNYPDLWSRALIDYLRVIVPTNR